MSNLRLVLFFLMMFLPAVSGCRQEAQEKPAPPPPSIGITVVTEGFQEIIEPFKQEMNKLAKERQIHITWKEATDGEEQKKHFEDFLKQKPGAIIAFMPDAETVRPMAQKVKEQDLKLLAVGLLPPDTPLDGYVGIDYRRIGKEQGEFLTGALQNTENPKVLILTTDPDSNAENDMLEGNREGLQSLPGVQLLEREMPKTKVALGLNKIWEEVGVLDAVITHETQTTREVLRSLAGQQFDPVTVGIGAGKEVVQFIAGGYHQGEVDVEPETMAGYALEAAIHLAETGDWEFDDWVDSGSYQIPVQYVPSRTITRENLSLLQNRYGTVEPKSPEEASGEMSSSSAGQEGESDSRQSTGNKIKVKLKEGKELEFQVPGEIESIEIQGQEGSQQDEGQQEESKG